MKRYGAGSSKYEAKMVQAYILVSLRKSIICHLWTRLKLTLATDGVRASQAVLVVKNLPAIAGDIRDTDSMPGSGRSPGGRHGNPLQYSCLENPMDRGAWQATVHGVAKSQR